jgi:mannose-6-phosphate isomerase-like protein (cupin superfamily)
MVHRHLTRLLAAAAIVSGVALPVAQNDAIPSRFTAHTIATGLTGGYQVVVADLNRDRKPDIIALASGLKELRWYENPGWQPHVLVSGINQPINAAAHDVDGDGIPEIALAHEFANVYTRSAGIVSILTHQGDPAGPWSMQEIDRVPTSHRLRFADVDGSGRKVLVDFPLIGVQAVAPDYRAHVPLLVYRPGAWKREVLTDADEGVVHGVDVTDWSGDRREALLSASFLGVHVLQFDRGRWTRTLITKGDPDAWPKSGSSDVAVGRLGADRFVATIEPWHGNQVVVYRQDKAIWTRHVIDDSIADGHTIVAGDFDRDGLDEIIVGERQGKRSAYLYRASSPKDDIWTKEVLDDGGMAAAGCAVADLNADTSPDVVCIGTATANLKWYENRIPAQENPHFVPADRVAVRAMAHVPAVDLAPGVHVRTVVGTTGSFSIGDFDAGSAAVLHHHTREQADVGITGVFDMTIGSHEEPLGPGAGVIVPANVAHSIANKRGGVMTVIEFHTVRRPDLVPPRPAMTFPSSADPVPVPAGRRLVVALDRPGNVRTIRGETCTLAWRRGTRGSTVSLEAGNTELFVYVVGGAGQLKVPGGTERVEAGTLVVVPAQGRSNLQVTAAGDIALVEFRPEHR